MSHTCIHFSHAFATDQKYDYKVRIDSNYIWVYREKGTNQEKQGRVHVYPLIKKVKTV